MSRARFFRFNPWLVAFVLAVVSCVVIWALMPPPNPRNLQPAPPEPVVQLAPEPKPEPLPKLAPNTDPNTIDVLVAAEDLPASTTITPKNIAKLVSWNRMAKDDWQSRRAATDENQLHNMRFWRPLRKGESISLLSTHSQSLQVPEGKEVVAIPLPWGRHMPFVIPGYRATLSATVRLEKRLAASIVARDVLILAVDDSSWGIVHVLVAVNPKEKELIEFALARECSRELILLDPESAPSTEPVDVEGVKKLLEKAPPKTPTQP